MFVVKEPAFVIRKLSANVSQEKVVHLTFDDGPNGELTPKVLQLLEKFGFTATFFVIGKLAKMNQQLVRSMLASGHSVYSHSIDHSYTHYFKGEERLVEWISSSINDLDQTLQRKSVVNCFRPPAGVINPPILRAAKKLNCKLVLWNHRFYDSVFSLHPSRMQYSIKVLGVGDILLFHDSQKDRNKIKFLTQLEVFFNLMKEKQFISRSIEQSQMSDARFC